uniref:AlNc14C96G5877 protein n=1 Tax=Albugo laibachii Nc14 TaxID=890382 RepID=F0WH02_9STRA|nr:AlNc14C96G5877 [Albugo laibachii Nc14]|eukprot:CCA20517.1 AlNc14C96G5877 [Albugo laibachii Nc14]
MNWMTSTYHRATNPKRAKQRKLMHFARHTAHEIHSGSSVQRERETDATPWYQTPVRADSESMDILMLQYGRSSVVEHHSGSRSDGDCVVTSESTRRCSFTPNPKVVSHGKGKCSTVLPNQDVPTILYYKCVAMRKAARSQCEQSAWSVVSDKARSNPPLTRYAEFSDCEYKCREATNNTLLPNIGGNRILQVSPQSSNINSPRLHQFDSDHTSNHITEEHHFRDTPPEYRPLHATAKDEDDEASLLSNVNSSDESDPIRRPEPALHLSEAFDCSREGYMQWSRPKSPESTVSNDALRMSNALAGNQSAETFISVRCIMVNYKSSAIYHFAGISAYRGCQRPCLLRVGFTKQLVRTPAFGLAEKDLHSTFRLGTI